MDQLTERLQFNEVKILKMLDHPSIVKMFEFFADKKHFYIVMDICKGGELFDDIVNRGKLKENEVAILMKQLLCCVNYMHLNNVIHRDLKPENILLEMNKDYSMIKIIDFGTAIVTDKSEHLKDRIGTPYYIAPEILTQNYNYKCDLWSCGVISYILLTGVKPFNGSSDQEVFKKIKLGQASFNNINWLNISDGAKEFTQWLLTSD
jgi:calcium-dependent protein kinase